MARADIYVVKTGGVAAIPTYKWRVASGTPPTVEAGEPVKQSAAGAETVVLLVDLDLTIGTDQPCPGIAAVDSAETASAEGNLDVYIPLVGSEWGIGALSAAAADAQSEIDALIGAHYVMDLTSSAFTMDTAAGGGANNAFLIVGGNPDVSDVFFMIRLDATPLGRGQV